MPDNDTVALARTRVESDLVDGLARSFTTDAGVTIGLVGLTDLESVAVSDGIVAVPWSYSCVHTGDFLGVPPTNLPVELRGATFVQLARDVDDWQYHRFVDFLGALHQLGVTTTTRPQLTPDEWDRYSGPS